MKKFLLIAFMMALAVGFLFGGRYNKLVGAEEGVKSAWAQVQNVYQRRLDLVPNLVETVKGYAVHEKETLTQITEARARISQINLNADIINNPEALKSFQAMQGSLAGVLSRLLVVAERYPDLKANQGFLALQTQLEGTENRITVERMRYNEAALSFNTLRRKFPNVVIANMMGFKEKAYFEASSESAQAPKVQF